jgi:glyoxylase-like metal-dependent hydrolase (beta-lactamase superfamily II)
VPFAEEVFWCGYTSESSFGAWSWLVRREAGNVLVDSPRAASPLIRGLEALGGASLLFLTHRDDIADHEALHARFGCKRVMHRDDGIRGLERYVEGGEPTPLADDLLAIPVPGHTRGSCALLYRNRFLFTGDHLWWEPSLGRLHASRSVNWWRWEAQVRSLEKLLAFDFEWVLPGHGAPWRAGSPGEMKDMLRRTLDAVR